MLFDQRIDNQFAEFHLAPIALQKDGTWSDSLASSAIPVGPSMLSRSMTRIPLKISVTCRPINRTEMVCHSPAG